MVLKRLVSRGLKRWYLPFHHQLGYTRLNYKQKERVLVKLFRTATNKPMNAYHLHLYVNNSTSCKPTDSCKISMCTLLNKPTYENKFTRHHTKKALQKRPVYTSSLLRLHKNICTTLICSRKPFITFTSQTKQITITLLLSCPNISISDNVVGNPQSRLKKSWSNPYLWIPCINCPKAPGRYLKFTKLPDGPLIDN